MSLTKREKQRLLEACESIDTNKWVWSCMAIRYHAPRTTGWANWLADKYVDFYFDFSFHVWPGLNATNTRKMRDHRIMLLLLFLAVEGELG